MLPPVKVQRIKVFENGLSPMFASVHECADVQIVMMTLITLVCVIKDNLIFLHSLSFKYDCHEFRLVFRNCSQSLKGPNSLGLHF